MEGGREGGGGGERGEREGKGEGSLSGLTPVHGSALVGMGPQTIPDPLRPFWTRVEHCGPMPTNADLS